MEIESRKRKRAGNWTPGEKRVLLTLIQKRIEIIENKCTSTNSNARKEHAWKDIYKEFCASFGDGDRSIVRLKEQWHRLKTTVKCNVKKQKKYRKSTGGGYPASETNDVMLDDREWKIVASLPHERTEDYAEFDSDALYELCEISLSSPSEGVTDIEDISTPLSTPISNPVPKTPDQCAVNASTVINNRQSSGSQEESLRDHSTSGRYRKDSAAKSLRMTEYETEVLLFQKEKHEVELKRGMEMHRAQMKNIEAKMKQDEEMHSAQMKRDDKIHELQKAKLLLEMEMLIKHI
ncbi:uncharacterized protein [Periplaneta americana]|uniref:uncharacterized protein n=1 Tax=Periplaneta americana TaxID=6978 RepID=UPI0037E74651